MFKKLFSFLIVLSMTLVLFTGVQISVSAEEVADNKCGDNLTWTLENGMLTISGSGNMANYSTASSVPWYSSRDTITSVVISNDVTSIGNCAFNGCSRLLSITIPSGVTSIGYSSFVNCEKLTSITIPDGVTSICHITFSGCSNLETVNIPYSVKTIEYDAFSGCSSLTSVTIPESVTSIGNRAFESCSSLTSVTIPESVTSIGNRAFESCSNLETVFYPDTCTVSGDAFNNTNATQIKYNVNGGKLTITDIITKGEPAPTSVTIGKMDGIYSDMTAETIICKEGLTVSGAIVSAATTKIEYTENDDGTLKITNIVLGSGKTAADIPATIGGKTVAEVAESYQGNVGNHTHTGGTSTCKKKAECTLCGTEYGELAAHNYENGECTVCHTPDPNTGGDDNNNDDNNDDNNNDDNNDDNNNDNNDDNNDDKNILLEKDGNTLTISGTGAVGSGDLSAVDGKDSITDVVIEDGITSVGDGAFDGFTNLDTVTIPDSVADIGENAFDGTKLDIVYYESGAGVEESDFPAGATQVEYSVNEDGKIIIESIKQGDVISEDGKIVIPDKIGDRDVAGVAEEVKPWVSAEGHEHKGGTATCSALAVCSVCASEYGELDPNYHTYVNGVCTGCNAADPNGGSQGTTPTTPTTPTNPTNPSIPSRPSVPSNPSNPAVTTASAETTTVTTKTADEEIIADGDYTGEDVSAGAADDSDDGGITDMSMAVLVIAIAAVIAAAVLVKKIVF